MTKYLNRNIFYITASIIVFIWLVFFAQWYNIINTDDLATAKRNGLFSVFTGSFLHGSFSHIIGNTKGLLISLPLLLYLYKKEFLKLTVLGLIIPSLISYLIGMSLIGISGLVFTYIWYIIFGIGSKDKTRFISAIVMILFYGGTLSGITLIAGDNIAYQTHLFGFLTALILSIIRYIRN